MCCIFFSCRALIEDGPFDRMAGGKTRDLPNHPDDKFTIGKTITDCRNLQEQPADFLIDTGYGGSGDEVNKQPVHADPVQGYPVIEQAGDLKKQVVQVLAEQQAARQAAAGKTAADIFQPGGDPAAAAGRTVEAGHIAGAVADKRHGLAAKGGDDHLADFTIGQDADR